MQDLFENFIVYSVPLSLCTSFTRPYGAISARKLVSAWLASSFVCMKYVNNMLEYLSRKLMTYQYPSCELGSIGPHTSVWILSSDFVACGGLSSSDFGFLVNLFSKHVVHVRTCCCVTIIL